METGLPHAPHNTLPSTRTLLTSLVSSIGKTATEDEQTVANPLADASEETKSLLLTLHTLFPNELLPALDLLDRGLVTRFALSRKRPSGEDNGPLEHPDQRSAHQSPVHPSATYYVRSSAVNPRSKYRVENPTYHEVYLNAWSCSCPAFAFSAFPATLPDDQSATVEDDQSTSYGWRFGGVTRGSDAPVCKHLLACVMIAHCEPFARMAGEKEVSLEEMAGWAAGWGD